MPLISWNNSLSVNVAEIDLQHKKLIAMINELSDAMKQGRGKDVLGQILNGLVHYTATHFKTEETYFIRFGYPDMDQHKSEHAAFVQKVSDSRDEFEKGRLALSVDIMNFLSDWLKNHIMVTDKKYSKFFNTNGLK